jgi:hypothetical protein
MNFRRAIERTPAIAAAYQAGLQALRRIDRERVTARHPTLLSGSIDLDSALAAAHPRAPRWDYGIARKRRNGGPDFVAWVEVHPAQTSTHIEEVLSKLAWIKNWLAQDGHLLNRFDRSFHWVSSGRTAFTKTAPQLRKLAQNGLTLVGGHLPLD